MDDQTVRRIRTLKNVIKDLEKNEAKQRQKTVNGVKVKTEAAMTLKRIKKELEELQTAKYPTLTQTKSVSYEVFGKMSRSKMKQLGGVTSLNVDCTLNKYLIVGFRVGTVHIYDLEDVKKPTLLYKAQYPGIDPSVPLYVDDFGTYMAYMDSKSRAIKYQVFDWDYRYTKIQKMDFSKQMSSQKKLPPRVSLAGKKIDPQSNLNNLKYSLAPDQPEGDTMVSKVCSIF